jgi:hypothetical protein
MKSGALDMLESADLRRHSPETLARFRAIESGGGHRWQQ